MTRNELNCELIMKDIQRHIESGSTYIDAIVEYAERHEIELEVLGEIIKRSPVLKAQVQNEAEELNMIEPIVRLPI